jgi:hypothetical protein
MEDIPERGAGEPQPPTEALVSVRNLVGHFREVVPLILGGTEGEIVHALSIEANESSLTKYEPPLSY